MIAQDQGVPVHAGSLADAVQNVIERAGEVREGDVFLHNDPYNGGTHQADGLVCRPIVVDGELLGFAANRGHWTDIGGMAPGGWAGAAEDVVQEGLLLPVVRLVREGVVDDALRRLILRNVRIPSQLWGDIQAQIASNIVAERRIRSLVDRHGRDGYDAAIETALDYSRRRFLTALQAIPDGEAAASDFIEDDNRGNGPFTIRVRVAKTPDGVLADFTGTDPQANAPINSTLGCTKAGVVAVVIALCDATLPLNAGVTDLIRVVAPPGTLVHPVFPAPTFGATADPVDRVSEALLKAFEALVPDRVRAGSYATGNNVTGGGLGPDGLPFLWYSYQSGGCGAVLGHDGNSSEWHLMGNSRNESMETWEARYPVEYLGYRLIPDSGGAGRFRGGLGTERRLRLLADTRVSGISDHHRVGARGSAGGRPGLPNRFLVERGGISRPIEELYDLPSPSKFSNLQLQRGDVFVSIQGGGGGFGDPRDRDPALLSEDVADGYVSAAAADAYADPRARP
jgi:N-methylhydantoinase B/oxoprolinase/acetone carboxylase alpha subunit